MVAALPIAREDTAQTLHDRLASLGARLIVEALHDLPPALAQDSKRATYAAKITKAEARIEWTRSAADIDRAVRAYNPVPGAYTSWQGQPLKIWRAEPLESCGNAVPGTVLQAGADGLCVATGEGSLRLLEVQRAGGRRMDVRTFLAGATFVAGEPLGD
jgi:methionyl-tRNA formyltransferase